MPLSQILTGSLANNITITTTGNVSANIVSVGTSAVSPVQSFRNKIINGGIAIDQRNSNASQTITAAAALAYTVDRWYAYCTGANVTGQQVANTGTSTSSAQKAYRFTGAASVTAIGFGQRIEASNCYDLANTNATLSVNLSNSVLTTVTWTAYYANTADTFGTLASPTRTQIATGTFTVSSTLTRYTTNISIPAAATTGIEIVFTVGAQTSGTWTIGNVQLEAGSVATPYEVRPVGTELALCQRYFQSYLGIGPFRFYGYNVGTGNVILSGLFIVPMRVSPTGTKLGTWTVSNASQPVVSTLSAWGYTVYTTVTTTGASDAYQDSADDGFTFSAEL